MSAQLLGRVAAVMSALCLGACNGLYFGDNPGRDVAKETGPLTIPPASVRNGNAR